MTKTCPLNNNKCVESCMWFDTGFMNCKIIYYMGELSKDIADINSLLFEINKKTEENNKKLVAVASTIKPGRPPKSSNKKTKGKYVSNWNEEQAQLLKDNWNKVSKEELEQIVGKKWRQILGKVARLNLGKWKGE